MRVCSAVSLSGVGIAFLPAIARPLPCLREPVSFMCVRCPDGVQMMLMSRHNNPAGKREIKHRRRNASGSDARRYSTLTFNE